MVKKTDPELKTTDVEGNVYALYVDNELRYIGERQSDKIASRLNNHLHSCPRSTNSKLKEIDSAYASNKKVSYKTLLIEPDYQRYALETYLIQNITSLPWNVRDRKKVVTFETSDSDKTIVSVEKTD